MPARLAAAGPVAPEYEIPRWLDDPEATPVIPPPKPGLPVLRQPSKWTCMPTAFTMVLAKGKGCGEASLLLGDVLHQLGRDDERGFHVQEMLGIAISLDVAFVRIESKPDLQRPPCFTCKGEKGWTQRLPHGHEFWSECSGCDGSGEEPLPPMVLPDLKEMLLRSDAVLLGTPSRDKNRYHAVAWCQETKKCLDPDGPVYGIEEFDVDEAWIAFRGRS